MLAPAPHLAAAPEPEPAGPRRVVPVSRLATAVQAGPPRADTTVIRRETPTQLSSKDVLAGLRSVPVVKARLDERLAQGPTALTHVKRALENFDRHLALKTKMNAFVNEAIRIATVIDATAAELARAVNDPTLKWQIATELIAAYRAELQQKLGSAKNLDRQAQTTKALDLAAVVVGDDPVTLYVSGKVKIGDAAWRVREMAVKAGLGTAEMMRILSDRFQMEVGSHSRAEVSTGQRKADTIVQDDGQTGTGGFDLKDLIGEISPSFYDEVVAPRTGPPKKGSDAPQWGPGGLAMTPATIAKLADLEKEASRLDLQSSSLSSPQLAAERTKSGDSLSAKQSEHFARLRQEESGDAADYESTGTAPRDYVVDKLMARYAIADRHKAETLTDDLLGALTTVPLTLTSKLENLFKVRADAAAEPHYGSAYKSEPALMQQEVDLSALVGKAARGTKAMSIGRPDAGFARSRGENYLRWRRDKDERETGYHGLGADDLPVFAAVNPNFTETMGGNANLATWDSRTQQYTGTTYGENYYGDMHMLLKDSVRPRSTFIARGKKSIDGRRIERTDLTFLLADMLRMFMFDYVDAMVAALHKPDTVVLTNMDAEVHVYGGLDIATDVQAIYLSPAAFAATDGAAARCKAFAKQHSIKVEDIGTMPATYDITARQGVQGGIDLKGVV
ncbi:MAG: hypothetical protein EPN43_07870 [Jatrophihabitans sp.]|nr:MAG: hypothetical protein EPN43_07870 [Jatrophihabitans sp.]